MKLEDFYTRSKANEGRKFYVPGPDGAATDQWLRIHHSDCDSFREGKAAILRQGIEIAKLPKAERAEARKRLDCELAALCVSDWSFGDFDADKLIELMLNAPYIRDFVERQADDGKLFFGNPSSSYASSPGGTQVSKKSRKAASSQKEST